jgi:hypothetical protein
VVGLAIPAGFAIPLLAAIPSDLDRQRPGLGPRSVS